MSRKDPTILFQYKVSPKLGILLEGIKQFVIDNSKEDIFRFFNIDEARGLWLDQLGAYLGINRPLIDVVGSNNYFNLQDNNVLQFQNEEVFEFNSPESQGFSAFVMDSSLMDGGDLLDGTSFATDDIYRNYIKGRIFKRNSRFTVDDIITLLHFTFEKSKVLIEEDVKALKIFIGVETVEDKINLELLNDLDKKWFGTPSGVGIEGFDIYILPTDSTFFIMDYNEMDNPNYLIG
jgi:hypothetical protein